MVRFAKPHVSVISTDLGRNIMVLISLDFTKGNLIVRFGIPLISVIFKNSAAVTNTRPDYPDFRVLNIDFIVIFECPDFRVPYTEIRVCL